MGQVKIKRLKEWANRRFSYKILADGQEQFELANGQDRIVAVDNVSTIQAKLMWCGSKRVDISVDKEEIKEIRIRANKGMNIRIPIAAMTILMIGIIINIVSTDPGLKNVATLLAGGVILGAIAQLTIWRNRFLDIELVKYKSTNGHQYK